MIYTIITSQNVKIPGQMDLIPGPLDKLLDIQGNPGQLTGVSSNTTEILEDHSFLMPALLKRSTVLSAFVHLLNMQAYTILWLNM